MVLLAHPLLREGFRAWAHTSSQDTQAGTKQCSVLGPGWRESTAPTMTCMCWPQLLQSITSWQDIRAVPINALGILDNSAHHSQPLWGTGSGFSAGGLRKHWHQSQWSPCSHSHRNCFPQLSAASNTWVSSLPTISWDINSQSTSRYVTPLLLQGRHFHLLTKTSFWMLMGTEVEHPMWL